MNTTRPAAPAGDRRPQDANVRDTPSVARFVRNVILDALAAEVPVLRRESRRLTWLLLGAQWALVTRNVDRANRILDQIISIRERGR